MKTQTQKQEGTRKIYEATTSKQNKLGWLWQSCFPSGVGKEFKRHITSIVLIKSTADCSLRFLIDCEDSISRRRTETVIKSQFGDMWGLALTLSLGLVALISILFT